ncbi:glycosyltransferase [Cognatishimia sp. SS12]|uniref:glycosyltransferase n=1 Tax=Cognatishimia sp. SS12 TaxID=2979465 RepID=UPI00232C8167|nr:glycosyltransferase [Cognatishimia sp. SS12]MDC0738709.1 glycosyltransferase [Cognatishimia sp. SS12]
MLGHIAYLAAIVLLAALVPAERLGEGRQALIVVGLLGGWRYSWALTNFARAIYFRRHAYPRRKAAAEAAYALRKIEPAAFFLCTSYKIAPEISVPVYQSLFRAAAAARGQATVVASVVDGADARLVRRIYEAMALDAAQVRLRIDQIAGTGKRDALASGLARIAAFSPGAQDLVVLVDGDSCVPADIIRRSAPFFTQPNLGALTTDEAVAIRQPGAFKDWFCLRFDQRQVMMCSMGLSNRVLTLTGRMSVFRADLATHPEFIRLVQHDAIDHWRLGRVDFLTGDDKSTWFWLMAQGYELGYLPDVRSVSMETQPGPRFLPSAIALMLRWFGNMLRTNARALRLPPRRIGLFVWWSIFDQNLSIWTTLAGPIAAISAALLYDPIVLPAYLAWIMLTRYLFCWAIAAFRGRSFPISFPFLLYFSQLMGAAVKSYVFFRLDRQKWTRQQTETGKTGPAVRRFGSAYLHVLALGWLALAVLLMTSAT